MLRKLIGDVCEIINYVLFGKLKPPPTRIRSTGAFNRLFAPGLTAAFMEAYLECPDEFVSFIEDPTEHIHYMYLLLLTIGDL